MSDNTKEQGDVNDNPLLVCSMNVQGLELKFTFSANEIKKQETIKNKLFLTYKEIFNQLKKNAENSSRFYDRIKNIS